MPTLPPVDQEFIVHRYAPLLGPRAPEAYRQVQRVWNACRERLGLTSELAGPPGSTLPPLEALARPGTGGAEQVVALRESPAPIRQAVLRREHDVLNLSVALATPAQPRLGWKDYAAMWAEAGTSETDALLGEVRLFLGRTPAGQTGSVEATAELGQALDALLPYRADRPAGWWRWGTTTTAGYALWDTGLTADTSASREIVLIGATDRDEELSAWAWSDRTAAMPPFARYLMHAAKLRFEARLLDSWHGAPAAGQDIDALVAELNAVLEPGRQVPDAAELLHALHDRLLAEEARLSSLDAELSLLGRTVAIARKNLAAQPGFEAGSDDRMVSLGTTDRSLANWLTDQVESDLGYLQIERRRTRSVRDLVTEKLGQLPVRSVESEKAESGETVSRASSVTAAQPITYAPADRDGEVADPLAPPDADQRVFVIYGRDDALNTSFFSLLREVGLKPLEWESLVASTGSATPYLGKVVHNAPRLAQAALVLLSPDDIVELHADLRQDNDHDYERARAGQARPNVLFELGLAYMAYPERTVIVEVGRMRPIADLAGLNTVRFNGSAVAIKKVLNRLKLAGCPVDTSGTDWLNTDRFSDLAAYHRGPENR